MTVLKINDLSKIFEKDITALSDINLEINDGEFMVLVGPSGCGKSTLLRIIAGLESSTNGNLFWKDKLLNQLPPSKRGIAMVFQNYALYPHMNVETNLTFGLSHRKLTKNEITKRLQETSSMLGINDLLNRMPKTLSGGQKQRVAIGRAIIRKPNLFLFDEPLSNLDAKLRIDMRREILKLHQKLKTTTIYVTHDQTEAMSLGSRICVLKNGAIQQIGTPMEIYHKPANFFVASFIGSPQMNFVHGKLLVQDNKTKFSANNFDLKIPLNATKDINHNLEKLTLGIRPKYLKITSEKPDIQTKIESIEMLGDHKILHTKIGNDIVSVQTDSDEKHKVGDLLSLSFDHTKIHFFGENGEIKFANS